MRNIVLTGFMIVGKTTVGRILAQRLGLDFVDTDQEIEKVTGRTVSDLIDCDGPVRFRSEEAMVIKKLSTRKGLVIATGGGAVLNPNNVAELKKNGVVVLIRSTPEIIFNRAKAGHKRPLLAQSSNLRQRIEELMDVREETYRNAADLEVFSLGESKEKVVSAIITILRERNYINK